MVTELTWTPFSGLGESAGPSRVAHNGTMGWT